MSENEGKQILKTLDIKFGDIDAKFDKIDTQFEKIDAKFDKIDTQFEKIDAKFDKMDERFDSVDSRFDAMEVRLDNFATKEDLKNGLDGLESRLRKKIEEASKINIDHHLETKAMVGGLEGDVGAIKDKFRLLAEV